jgi:hypothetical protein
MKKIVRILRFSQLCGWGVPFYWIMTLRTEQWLPDVLKEGIGFIFDSLKVHENIRVLAD